MTSLQRTGNLGDLARPIAAPARQQDGARLGAAERFHHVSGRLAHGRQGRGKFFHDGAPERVGKLLEGGVDLGPHLAAGKACSIRWAVAQLTEASASDMP